jgi:hypothetical protein
MAMSNMGRPPFTLTDEQFKTIEGLARIQCTQVEICDIFDVTEKTLNLALKKHSGVTFSQLIKKNMSHGKASLRRNQWKAADKGVPSILIWLGKQHLGQKEQVENTGAVEVHHFDGWEIERAQSNPPETD